MTPGRLLTAGLVLTASAGFIDAVGFISLGGFYASFMSGNTTQLGTGMALHSAIPLALPAGLIVLFFIGSFLGAFVAQSSARWGSAATLTLVLACLAISLMLHFWGFDAAQSMLPLAVAAGAQNSVLPPVGAARLGATFVTGTLFAAGQDLARATNGTAPPWRWLQHLLVWASLLAGALVGALAYAQWQTWALLVPALVYAAALVWFAARPAR